MVESRVSDTVQSIVDYVLEHAGKAVSLLVHYCRLRPRHQQA